MKREVICGIYKITSPSGKVYIGQGKNILRRFTVYKSLNCKLQKRLYASFQKYGVLNHIFEIVEECLKEHLDCRERYWQDFYNVIGDKGLNCVLTQCLESNKKGGISEDKRERLSESHKNIKPSEKSIIVFKEMITNRVKSEQERLAISNRLKGENHHFYGKQLSVEHKEKISKGVKGKRKNVKLTTEHRKKLSDIKRKKNEIGEFTNARLVLCTHSGIFYYTVKEASYCFNIKNTTLCAMLSGQNRNRTSLIYC